MLSESVKRRNDAELLLKMGGIRGAYAAYTQTGDVRILEHLIIDVILLLQAMMSDPVSVRGLSESEAAAVNEPTVSTETLIDRFLTKQKEERATFSDNTRSSYASSLRKLFKDMQVQAIPERMLRGFVFEIDRHLNGHPEYNHNIKSAAAGLSKYILEMA